MVFLRLIFDDDVVLNNRVLIDGMLFLHQLFGLGRRGRAIRALVDRVVVRGTLMGVVRDLKGATSTRLMIACCQVATGIAA